MTKYYKLGTYFSESRRLDRHGHNAVRIQLKPTSRYTPMYEPKKRENARRAKRMQHENA